MGVYEFSDSELVGLDRLGTNASWEFKEFFVDRLGNN